MGEKRAILLIDHGSRREASNALLLSVAEDLRKRVPGVHVEPCHLEIAEPSIAQGFDACVAAGATEIIALPYFLSPGRHSTEDIPREVREAADRHPSVSHRVAPPLGPDDLLIELLLKRYGAGE